MSTEARVVLSAIDNTGRAFASVRQNLSGIGTAVAGVRTALAGLGALTAAAFLSRVIEQTRAVIDQFNDLSDATGSSIENISALDRIARETGGTFEQVSSILVKFNQVLKDAEPDKGAGAVLKALNLDLEQLKRLDPAEALRQTAVALRGFADDGNKARAVQELFGKSVREAAPFLKDLAEANGLVATTSTQTAEEIDEYNKNLSRLKANAEDLSRTLTYKLVPVLNQVLKDVNTFGQKASLAGLASDVIKAKKELDALQSRRDSPFNFAGNLEAEIAAATKRLQEAKAAFNAADRDRPKTAGGGRGFVNPEIVRPSLDVPPDPKKTPKAPKETPFTGLTYDEQIAQRAGRLLEDSDVTRAKEYADTLGKLDELYFSGAIGAELYDSAVKGLNGSTSAAADQTSEFTQQQKRLAELLSQTESAGIEAQRRDMELLTKALQDGTIKEAEYLEAASARLDLVAEKTSKAKTFAEEFGLTFTSAFEDAIVKGGDLSDVLEGLEQDILRIILRKQVTEPLGDLISSGMGAFFKSIFPSAKGNVFAGAPGLSTYSNTVVNKPTVFPFAKGIGLMGEAGAEAIMPLTRLPNGDLGVGSAAGAGGASVTVNVINQGGGGLQVVDQRRRTGADGEMTIDVLVEVLQARMGENVANGSGGLSRGLENRYGLRPSQG